MVLVIFTILLIYCVAVLQSRQDSFGVSATVTAASAFGDDLADISYSIPELSQYKEDKSKKHGKHKEEAFIKTIYLNIDRQESSVHDQEENGEHTSEQQHII
uniref:Uncharacterized protein n=1 Tax=Biomphalaria glabrata TaxID=6526 RepID=A0A2C9KYM7_BIOGL